MIYKLLTEHQLEFLSLKGGCTGSSESTLVKMPYCWKSHAAAHINPRPCHARYFIYYTPPQLICRILVVNRVENSVDLDLHCL